LPDACHEFACMHLSEFLDFDAVSTRLSGGNKRSLLQQLAQMAATRLGVEQSVILASITEREQLGSTGFGQGVAIPHGKLGGLTRIYGLFARLAEPVDYKAIDGRRVDLVFLLLSPPDAGAEHLKALAAISRVTRHGPTLDKMRGARSRDALAAVLMGADERDAA
jgi:nitrogen PTS system EIIA component